MTYWHIQFFKERPDKEEERLLKQKALIGISGESTDNQIQQFRDVMNIGDIVLVRRGAKVYALVEVIGELEEIPYDYYKDEYRLDWFKYRRKVKVLDLANENMDAFPQRQGSLQRLVNKNTKSYQYIDNWYKQTLQKNYNKGELKEGTYKIKELYIKDNQKIFQDFKIDFTSDGKNPLPIIVIAGKNGTGKTTLLEYLANLEIQNSDYIEIFKVRKLEELEIDWDNDDNELIVDSFKIIDGMKGIQATKKEYSKHIEYLSVDIQKIENIKKFIYNRYKKRIRELPFKEVIKEISNFIENIFKGMELSFKLIDIDDTQTDDDDKVKVNITFQNKNGKEFDIDNLSTGEKTLLSKILYLYFKDIKNQIILIDEPELSLHPAWQNRVLKLYENFAEFNNCQIIIATHSPHIIGSAKNEWIRILTEDGVINDVLAYGRDIEWVLEEVMGASYTREPTIAKKIEECQKLLDDEKYDEAEKLIDALEKIIGEDDSEIRAMRNDIAFWRD